MQNVRTYQFEHPGTVGVQISPASVLSFPGIGASKTRVAFFF